jgi:error-prone DNA polymerase
MGFYSTHTLVDDVKRAGVPVLPLHPNLSEWDCTICPQPDGRKAIRVGFRVVSGLGREEFERIAAERRANGPYRSLGDFVSRARISRPQVLERLAMGEAFECFGLSQRQSLWDILEHRNLVASEAELARYGHQLSFFGGTAQGAQGSAAGENTPALFLRLSEPEAIRADYQSYGLSTRGHPMGALRKGAPDSSIFKNTSLMVKRSPSGRQLKVAGLVIVRQRPPTAKGTAFATLEDEEGFLDLVLHEEVYEKYREVFVSNAFLLVSGKVQADAGGGSPAFKPTAREHRSVSLIVSRVEALSDSMQALKVGAYDFH